jgi:hypothetical protein
MRIDEGSRCGNISEDNKKRLATIQDAKRISDLGGGTEQRKMKPRLASCVHAMQYNGSKTFVCLGRQDRG